MDSYLNNQPAYETVYAFEQKYFGRPENKLERFKEAQDRKYGDKTIYETAVGEINSGLKVTHWIWFVFPQLRGLGHSHNSFFYGLDNLDDAIRYLSDNTLYNRLSECAKALLKLETNSAVDIFGHIDASKLRSSMTLFSACTSCHDDLPQICHQVISKYFDGIPDEHTSRILNFVNINEVAVHIRALSDPFDTFSSEWFNKFNVPSPHVAPTQENLCAEEDYFINLAKDWCSQNNIGFFAH
jgi:uncharacterized protein (DUF1810 family)